VRVGIIHIRQLAHCEKIDKRLIEARLGLQCCGQIFDRVRDQVADFLFVSGPVLLHLSDNAMVHED
jgi:hypothetical protein